MDDIERLSAFCAIAKKLESMRFGANCNDDGSMTVTVTVAGRRSRYIMDAEDCDVTKAADALIVFAVKVALS
jgi:hypothetical protein